MKFIAQETGTIFDLLCRRLHPASRTTVRKLLKHGVVWLGGAVTTRGDAEVRPGDPIEIRRTHQVQREEPPVPILYEDPLVLAVNKPAGLLSIATDQDQTRTLYKLLNQHLQDRSRGRERIFIVHRLDREVSGIMLFAKSVQAQERLQRDWSSVRKLYCALVQGHPPEPEGTIRSWLRENSVHNVYSGPEGPDARLSVTRYRLLKELPGYSLLEIELETGRKHQIRVHLSEMGCPVAGDRRYGAKPSPIRRFGLWAYTLSFDSPRDGQRVDLRIPVPGLGLPLRFPKSAPPGDRRARGRGTAVRGKGQG